MKTLIVLAAGLLLLLVDRPAEAAFGQCNGCTFHVPTSGGTMTLNGTPTTSTPPGRVLWYSAVVNTDQGQSYRIYPLFGVPMNNLPVPNIVAGTMQASITWAAQISGVGTITWITPLMPQ